jgi:hypothetical protein
VPGLAKLSPEGRRLLLDLAEELGISVDSLATVIAHESGWNPAAGNSLPAAGLIQLTLGAKLPGFDTPKAVEAIRAWSAERQLREVVRPFYARMAAQVKAIRGGSPGTLVLSNFLPADVGQPPDFRLGDSAAPEGSWRWKVYRWNDGLDASKPKKGYFTVADVYDAARRTVAAAHGQRIRIDGSKLGSPGAPADPAKPARRGDASPGARGDTAPAPRVSDGGSARGLLLAAVEAGLDLPVQWVTFPWEGLSVRVGAHALRAPNHGRALRLPVSFREALAIARRKDWVLPTAALSDAIWRAAEVKLTPKPLPPVDMAGLAHVLRHNQQLDDQIGTRAGALAADEGKDWILSARNQLPRSRATNYGWRATDGRPLQPLGPDDRPPPHDDQHVDYSQVLRPIQRLSQEGVDLLEVFVRKGLPPAEAGRLR